MAHRLQNTLMRSSVAPIFDGPRYFRGRYRHPDGYRRWSRLLRESVTSGELESIGRNLPETGIFSNPCKFHWADREWSAFLFLLV